MRVKRTCLVCEMRYWATKANAKYCGEKCQKEAQAILIKRWKQKQKELFKRRLKDGV